MNSDAESSSGDPEQINVPQAHEGVMDPQEEHVDSAGSLGLLEVGAMGFGGVVVLILAAFLLRSALLGGKAPAPLIGGGQEEETVAEEAAPSKDETPDVALDAAPTTGLATRLAQTLGRSRAALQEKFDVLFGRQQIDEAVLEELEEILLTADVGVPTTQRILDVVRSLVDAGEQDGEVIRAALRESMRSMLEEVAVPLVPQEQEGPWVLLVVGVNGSGKTTTIGKLASRWIQEGKQVMLAAADTYRAAAADQLQVWADRSGAMIVRQDPGADPGAVVYSALEAANSRGVDIVIVDTAGRLQTRKPLMEQLGKIRRVIAKQVPGAPHETLLVLDGTMGQNGLSQAKLFHEATPLTGAAVTKLDGTAKGGMVLTLAAELELPVKLIGIGEQIDDLRDFEASAFIEALT